MTRTTVSVCFVTLALPALAAAQQAIPDICSAAFRDGLRENYEVLTVKQRFEKFRIQLLSIQAQTYQQYIEKATNASAGLDIPIVDAMLGFSADASTTFKQSNFQSRYNQLRNDVNFQQQIYETFKSTSSVLNVALASVWNDCARNWLDAYVRVNTANGVFLDVRPFDETAGFVARVTVRNDRIRRRKVVGITPAETTVVCTTAAGQPALNSTFDTGAFDLTCHKSPDRAIPFTVTTEDGATNTVNVPSRTSKLLEMRESFDELSRSVGTLRQALAGAQAKLDQLQKGIAVDDNGNVSIAFQLNTPNNKWHQCQDVTLSAAQRSGPDMNYCPDGYFLIGIDMDDIASVPPQSSPLPVRAKCCRH